MATNKERTITGHNFNQKQRKYSKAFKNVNNCLFLLKIVPHKLPVYNISVINSKKFNSSFYNKYFCFK